MLDFSLSDSFSGHDHKNTLIIIIQIIIIRIITHANKLEIIKIYLPYLSSKEFQKFLSLSRQPLPKALSKKGFRFLNQAP